MDHDSPTGVLLECALRGMQSAWQEIIESFSPLIFAVCHRYGISGADTQDVAGAVWLRLVANVATIREPKALPGWLQTTTRNECRMLLRQKNRDIPTGTDLFDGRFEPDLDARLIDEERRATARRAFAQLPRPDRELLSMLFSDPPKPYKEISSALGIPIGAIGPTRARCLRRARHTPAIAALIVADRRDCRGRAPVGSHDLQSVQAAR
jgi:RNA polymerase sigma factor (sigma-70 family)